VLCIALPCSVLWCCAFVLFETREWSMWLRQSYCGDTPLNTSFDPTLSGCPAGTKEEVECSGQGMCDEHLGQCTCFEGFGSSNGTIDNPGER
jgi:hypothetical protein